jgi:hypothetical protein
MDAQVEISELFTNMGWENHSDEWRMAAATEILAKLAKCDEELIESHEQELLEQRKERHRHDQDKLRKLKELEKIELSIQRCDEVLKIEGIAAVRANLQHRLASYQTG